MFTDHILEFQDIVFIRYFLCKYHRLVRAHIQIVVLIQYISDSTAHAGGKVLSGSTEDYDTTTGHVLTSVITDPLNNGCRTGVTNTETFTCDTIDECLTTCRAIQSNVTDDDVLILLVCYTSWRIYDQLTTG